MSNPNDVPCCCDCGVELGPHYCERDVTERDPWAIPAPDDYVVVELICRRCDAARS